MGSLTIPANFQPGLKAIAEISEESFDELLEFLARITPPIDLRLQTLSSLALRQIRSVSGAELRKIIRTLVALYSVRASSDASLEDFVGDVARAMERAAREDAEPNPYAGTQFKDRLLRLLGFPALDAASKALYLQAEHERTFCDAKILTDARPVYLGAPTDSPQSAVVTHTLRLAFHEHESGGLKAIYIALDGDDINKLRDLLDRAQQKAKSLRALLEKAGVQFIFP